MLPLLFFGLLIARAANAQTHTPTAREIIQKIQANLGVRWHTPTVDTFKAGDPDTPITGIAVTMMATYDVLERAAVAGKNLIITHEPTFYSHQDETANFERDKDPVFAQKEAFIKEHHMVVWRFHDNWHAHHPDGILLGMTKALGWQAYQNPSDPNLFTLPQQTLAELAESVKNKLGIHAMRVAGDPNLRVTQVALLPGAAGEARQIALLERNDVQVLLIGEVPEWETIEYAADAASERRPKALILMTHIVSEQAGMEECARWLKTFITDTPIEFVPTKELVWPVK
jgi:putative NIF3 family GTP cyclohydrolase 1 type 2